MNGLYLVKKNEKTKKIQDFLSCSKNFENVSVGKGGIYAEKRVYFDCAQASEEKIYNTCGAFGECVAVADGGGVYKKHANSLVKIATISDKENVIIVDFDDNDKKRYALLGEQGAYLCDGTTLTEVDIPYGKHAA
jgi:hypothetical protein